MSKKNTQLSEILRRLLFERNMKPITLAREVALPAPTIHRLITGKSTRPYKSSLQPIADYFSITLEQLIGEQPLSPHLNINATDTHGIYLIPWDELINRQELNKNNLKIIPFHEEIMDNIFATTAHDSSMEPLFTRNSLLIFNADKIPADRNYVLVELYESQSMVFRQLVVDFDHQYLKPLNPDLNEFGMRLLHEKDKIIATLIEARQIY